MKLSQESLRTNIPNEERLFKSEFRTLYICFLALEMVSRSQKVFIYTTFVLENQDPPGGSSHSLPPVVFQAQQWSWWEQGPGVPLLLFPPTQTCEPPTSSSLLVCSMPKAPLLPQTKVDMNSCSRQLCCQPLSSVSTLEFKKRRMMSNLKLSL